MAKDKERTLNPAQAQRKLEKQKALRKGKASVLAQRTSRLAARNPDRLERQIAELKELKQSAGGEGKLGARERKQLEDAERDLARVRKAREVVGGKGGGGGGGRGGGDGHRGGGLGGREEGKRRRDETSSAWKRDEESEAEEDTDESVRQIPMPRDTPPPIPSSRHRHPPTLTSTSPPVPRPAQTNANLIPLGTSRLSTTPVTSTAPVTRPAPKTTYESLPSIRDLRKEATEKFIPAAVRRNLARARGEGGGGLVEEEEMERLEKGGYGTTGRKKGVDGVNEGMKNGNEKGRDEQDVRRRTEAEVRRLREEEERFERELALDEEGTSHPTVAIEDVQDEDL
ncbi:hypothetical protein MMC07_005846 [Pseudocyphellaria aurata]|nr:hypothetical protein [Pseudocyphellaria aurata]